MTETITFYSVSDDYGCFSNFAPYPIELDGNDFHILDSASLGLDRANGRLCELLLQRPCPYSRFR